MLAKAVVLLLLAAITAALFTGAFFMLRDRASSENRRTLRALKWRVALQLTLILFLVLAYFMGWIHPHDVLQR